MEYLTKSPSETKNLGERIAKKVLKTKPKEKAFVIGLIGELGGGKTTFLQGFARGLGIKEKILSPSFVIMKRFDISHKGKPTVVLSAVGFLFTASLPLLPVCIFFPPCPPSGRLLLIP